jgi:hypothetical protein
MTDTITHLSCQDRASPASGGEQSIKIAGCAWFADRWRSPQSDGESVGRVKSGAVLKKIP